MKDQSVNKSGSKPALAGWLVSILSAEIFRRSFLQGNAQRGLAVCACIIALFVNNRAQAISLDDIQLWTGSGTNRAALVVEWSVPESAIGSSVPAPVTDKTLVWGYRFNGPATGTQMLQAVVASDPRLYVVVDETYGTFVEGMGYHLSGNGVIALSDGQKTDYLTNGFFTQATVDVDAAHPLDAGDLYWGGYYGPNWEVWNEAGDAGGFLSSPNRGTNVFWTADDPTAPYSGLHGQWELAGAGLDSMTLTNGSWIGFSVAAGEYEGDTNAPYNLHKHAPVSPDGNYAAYVYNTNGFAVQVVSTNNIYAVSPYNNPNAVLGRPTLKFIDYFGDQQAHRTKIIEPPYWTDPATNDVITEISNGGQITVQLGRKVYHDANNPYGIDLIIYGNSFLSASGPTMVDDTSDLDTFLLGSGINGHVAQVAVSQDGTNWYAVSTNMVLYPDNAYRWDETNHAWTDEEMNPTKPLNPYIHTNNFAGDTVASGLDQFIGAAGGSGVDISTSGLPWIQYVRITPGAGTYTVIDAIAAVNPAAVGDALSIAPDNLAAGITNLAFENPGDASEDLITLHFDALSDVAKVSTVSLHEFSSFAPVEGHVSSAYQLALKPVTDATPISFQADLALHVASDYSGNGSDLRVWQWAGTNWAAQPFVFDPATRSAVITGVTNVSAYVVSQIIPPAMKVQPLMLTNSPTFEFTPVPNCQTILERSTNLISWTPVVTLTPTNEAPVTVQDSNAPAGKAFYRLRVTVP